jgi:hypothetical protein
MREDAPALAGGQMSASPRHNALRKAKRKVRTPADQGRRLHIVILPKKDIEPDLLWPLRYASERLQIPIQFLRCAVGNGDLILYSRHAAEDYRVRALDALALYQREQRILREKRMARAQRRREARLRSRSATALPLPQGQASPMPVETVVNPMTAEQTP